MTSERLRNPTNDRLHTGAGPGGSTQDPAAVAAAEVASEAVGEAEAEAEAEAASEAASEAEEDVEEEVEEEDERAVVALLQTHLWYPCMHSVLEVMLAHPYVSQRPSCSSQSHPFAMLHFFSDANRDKWQSSGTFWQSQLYLEEEEEEEE